MLKREITYKDFNDEEVTEIVYFNLSKTEIVDMEVEHKDGLEATIKRIISANDSKRLIAEFKRIILLSYGEKSEDGKRFIKSDESREAFSQTAAFDALFMELATNDTSAAAFINGILPKDMVEAISKMPSSPPTPPQAPTPTHPVSKAQPAPGVSTTE